MNKVFPDLPDTDLDNVKSIYEDTGLPHFATDIESDIDNLKSLYGDKGLHHFATDLESDVDNVKSIYEDTGLPHFATDLENDIDIDGENLDHILKSTICEDKCLDRLSDREQLLEKKYAKEKLSRKSNHIIKNINSLAEITPPDKKEDLPYKVNKNNFIYLFIYNMITFSR